MTCCIPTRYFLAILLMGVITHYFTLRSNFSILVVAMVKQTPINGNNSRDNECSINTTIAAMYSTHKDVLHFNLHNETGLVGHANSTEHKNKFPWDSVTQSRIIGAYSYGHVFCQVPGGFLEARFGGKKVLGLSMMLSSVLTLMTPAAAFAGEWSLFVVRVVVGFVQGVVWPCSLGVLSRWTPPSERGRLLAIVSTGLVGVGASLVAAGHVRCDATAAIAMLCLATVMGGVLMPGFYPIYTELTLGFSGVAFGISTAVANCAGFIVPLMVGILTAENVSLRG
ncbi:sialin-like [Branchiostoma lanceolatum]|uniref:sialin-like n=1 Tax=Branchiostoma lanceolatum TaxID=7740 RepID=UPI0034519BA6